MALPPRPVRALPDKPAQDTEVGATTSLIARIVIVITVVIGQLFALTVALEESLLDRDVEATYLAIFSVVSFIVVLALTRIEPPPRASRLPERTTMVSGTYVSRRVDPGSSTSGSSSPGPGAPATGADDTEDAGSAP